MKISLIHPSRSRPDKAKATARKWIDEAGVPTEHIFSVDHSDPKASEYFEEGFTTIQYPNTCVVEATNQAAKVSTGDLLLYLSDDFDCYKGWGLDVVKQFENENRPLLIKCDDGLQQFNVPVLTIPIMNRALYDRLGYFWHPEYKSMFVDEDLYWTAFKLAALKMCPQIKFQHNHPSNGKAANDEVYMRSSANWDQGKALFAKRKAEGFQV